MVTQNEQITEQKTDQPGGAATPPAAPPPQVPAGQPPPAQAKPEDKKPAEPKPEPKRVDLKSAEAEIPEDAEIVSMPLPALKKRLAKFHKSELVKEYGTSDPAEIKRKLARADELEAAEEKRKQDAMTEAEKKDAALKAAEDRAERAERRANAVYQARAFEREDTRMLKLAEEVFDEDYAEDQLPKLAKHLAENYDDKQLDAMKPTEVDKIVREFFKELVERKPKLARGDAKVEKRKVAANNTASDKDRPGERREGADKNPAEGKTFKPGQQNSMTKAEAQAALRAQFGGRLPY